MFYQEGLIEKFLEPVFVNVTLHSHGSCDLWGKTAPFFFLSNTRMHSNGMNTACFLTVCGGYPPRESGVSGQVGVSAEGVAGGGVCPGGCLPGRCHVTYPIIHLMLPVCCLHTNWDPATVELLIYCWLIMWPARYTGIDTLPLLWTDRHLWKHNLRKLRLRAVNIFQPSHANWNKIKTSEVLMRWHTNSITQFWKEMLDFSFHDTQISFLSVDNFYWIPWE